MVKAGGVGRVSFFLFFIIIKWIRLLADLLIYLQKRFQTQTPDASFLSVEKREKKKTIIVNVFAREP